MRREAAELYRQFISPGDLCFDVGANVGEISEVMLQLGARVVAVEPQSENVRALEAKFSGNPNFAVVAKALGAKVGSGELMICGLSECSSMSAEFVEVVTGSGRLPAEVYQWNEIREVRITTLDQLVHDFGLPAFTKIDVEGFEAEVIKGCSHTLKVLSLEFTPERLEPALNCIQMLEKLGEVEFNYTVGFSKKFQLPDWVAGGRLIERLKNTQFPVVIGPGGDLYARFK
jgi:FkbM family methyltransferase